MSEYQLRRRPDNVQVMRNRASLRELAFVVLFVVVSVGAMLAWTWIQIERLAAGRRILQLEQQFGELRRTERELELEAAFLANPPRIDRRAREELDMVPPPPHRIIHLTRP